MLTTQNLTCRRSGRLVFRDVGFSVAAGGFVQISGPNGSGKSTLLRILAGLLEPKSGIILWGGENIAADPAAHRARTRYIGHLDSVKPQLTVRETLDYWRSLRGAPALSDDVLEPFGLARLGDYPVRHLSAGQRRRLSLTRLLLDDAPLWLLDEPTTALDVAGQELLRARIARHRASGGMVIAASHDDLALPAMQNFVMGVAR